MKVFAALTLTILAVLVIFSLAAEGDDDIEQYDENGDDDDITVLNLLRQNERVLCIGEPTTGFSASACSANCLLLSYQIGYCNSNGICTCRTKMSPEDIEKLLQQN